ncbi:MAG: LptA/OstA family protein [Nitrospirota bacterium]
MGFPGLLAQPVWGGQAVPASADGERTTITAKKMTVRNQESKAIFEGTVVLTKGTLTVYSDEMVVLFKPSEQQSSSGKAGEAQPGAKGNGGAGMPGNRAINLIEAMGHVRIEKDDGRATCQKAVYYESEEKIVLTGEPVAWQKGTKVSGKVITMYLAEERSVVEGETRVQIDQEPGGGR